MLNPKQAAIIVKKNMPAGIIQTFIEWKGLYIFQVYTPEDEFEGNTDPFYSINQETGEFRDFSIFDDGPVDELTALFMQKKR